METEIYVCIVCGLHYRSKKLAEECYAWCSKHNSCRLDVAKQSIEAQKS